jgi:hypothetical protein
MREELLESLPICGETAPGRLLRLCIPIERAELLGDAMRDHLQPSGHVDRPPIFKAERSASVSDQKQFGIAISCRFRGKEIRGLPDLGRSAAWVNARRRRRKRLNGGANDLPRISFEWSPSQSALRCS